MPSTGSRLGIIVNMHRDSDNKDYNENRLYVFDDKLNFSDHIKHDIVATLDYLPGVRTTFGVSVEPSTLTAEKKRKPDGTNYVLVRKAVFSEERKLFSNDDEDDNEILVNDGEAGANADDVVVDGPITRADVHQVLAFFLDIEPEPDEIRSTRISGSDGAISRSDRIRQSDIARLC